MKELNVPPLTEEQIKLLITALEQWAKSHPYPDNPLIAFADGEALSPNQLASEVSKLTRNGKAFIRMVQCGTEVASFDQILSEFTRTLAAHA